MLKINFISNTEDKNKVDKIFAAVNYEKGLMELDLLNENIAKQDAIIANKKGVKTKEDIAAAKIKKSKYEQDTIEVQKKIENLKPQYNKTIELILAAENKYTSDGKEYTAKNNLTTIRNILRLVACGDNTKFFKNAILPDINNKSYELLYKAFETLHGCNENDFDENGKRIYKDDKLFATIKKDVQMIVKNMFSIPVSNELTKKVNVKFNSTDLGTLHECYVKGINVSVNKNYKTGEVTYKTVTLNTSIIKKENKDGNVTFESKGFNELLAKLAFKYICK